MSGLATPSQQRLAHDAMRGQATACQSTASPVKTAEQNSRRTDSWGTVATGGFRSVASTPGSPRRVAHSWIDSPAAVARSASRGSPSKRRQLGSPLVAVRPSQALTPIKPFVSSSLSKSSLPARPLQGLGFTMDNSTDNVMQSTSPLAIRKRSQSNSFITAAMGLSIPAAPLPPVPSQLPDYAIPEFTDRNIVSRASTCLRPANVT